MRGLQQRLQRAGFDPGPIDGRNGPRTRQALEAFQRATGGQASGAVTPSTLRAMGQRPPSFANVVGTATTRPQQVQVRGPISGGVDATIARPRPGQISGGIGVEITRPAPSLADRAVNGVLRGAETVRRTTNAVLERVPLSQLSQLPGQALGAGRDVAEALRGPGAQRITDAFEKPLGTAFSLAGRALTVVQTLRDTTARTIAGQVANVGAAFGAEAGLGALLTRSRAGALTAIDAVIGIGTTAGRAAGVLNEQQARFINSAAPGSIIGGILNNATTGIEAFFTGDTRGLAAAHERNLNFDNGVAAAIGANAYERVRNNGFVQAATDIGFGTLDVATGNGVRGRRAISNGVWRRGGRLPGTSLSSGPLTWCLGPAAAPGQPSSGLDS